MSVLQCEMQSTGGRYIINRQAHVEVDVPSFVTIGGVDRMQWDNLRAVGKEKRDFVNLITRASQTMGSFSVNTASIDNILGSLFFRDSWLGATLLPRRTLISPETLTARSILKFLDAKSRSLCSRTLQKMDVVQDSNLGDVDIQDFLWAIGGLGTEQTLQILHLPLNVFNPDLIQHWTVYWDVGKRPRVPESFRSIGACSVGSGLGHGLNRLSRSSFASRFPSHPERLVGKYEASFTRWSPINTGSNEDPLLEQDFVWPNDISSWSFDEGAYRDVADQLLLPKRKYLIDRALGALNN
ncbi:hypothetical protein C8J57DRAFT_1473556 [Mycena rebaudengoi]|nr:hypothetical protein C8J57DRAFT_1473556 [Mycena rebaudengoi]